MKGVILSINPDANIVDITHDISPQNVDEAAFVLNRAYSYFPEGTIHVAVVDPGVGSQRAILAVRTPRFIFLGPDNGLLKYILYDHTDADVFRLTNPVYFLKSISHTFHGRDIFAPAAAHISRGIALEKMGEPFRDYVVGDIRHPTQAQDGITGQIIYIDKFGNAITNIEESQIGNRKNIRIRMKEYEFNRLCKTYKDVPVGESLALIGSGGTVEISIHQGNAKDAMKLSVGDSISVNFE
jgi:S-adenosylmethionine hydrolase